MLAKVPLNCRLPTPLFHFNYYEAGSWLPEVIHDTRLCF
jgi:hypothetical protein